MQLLGLVDDSKLPIGVNVSANVCLSLCITHVRLVTRAGPYHTIHGSTGIMLGKDKKMKYHDRIWVKCACTVSLFSYTHDGKKA